MLELEIGPWRIVVSSSRLCFEFLSDFPQLRIRVWICKLKLHPLAHLAYSQTVLSQQQNKIQRQRGIDAYYIPGMNNRLQERGRKFGRLEFQVRVLTNAAKPAHLLHIEIM